VLSGFNEGRSLESIALEAGLSAEEVERSIHDVQQKRKTTRYLHMSPQIIESVIPETPEVSV